MIHDVRMSFVCGQAVRMRIAAPGIDERPVGVVVARTLSQRGDGPWERSYSVRWLCDDGTPRTSLCDHGEQEIEADDGNHRAAPIGFTQQH